MGRGKGTETPELLVHKKLIFPDYCYQTIVYIGSWRQQASEGLEEAVSSVGDSEKMSSALSKYAAWRCGSEQARSNLA